MEKVNHSFLNPSLDQVYSLCPHRWEDICLLEQVIRKETEETTNTTQHNKDNVKTSTTKKKTMTLRGKVFAEKLEWDLDKEGNSGQSILDILLIVEDGNNQVYYSSF